jgi:ribonuclease E
MDDHDTTGPDGPTTTPTGGSAPPAGTPDADPGGVRAAGTPAGDTGPDASSTKGGPSAGGSAAGGPGGSAQGPRRRRGSRGGRNRNRNRSGATGQPGTPAADSASGGPGGGAPGSRSSARSGTGDRQPAGDGSGAGSDRPGEGRNPEELPEPMREGRVLDPDVAERVLVGRPRIGDRIPPSMVPPAAPSGPRRDAAAPGGGSSGEGGGRSGRSRSRSRRRSRSKGGSGGSSGETVAPVQALTAAPVDLDDAELERRRGKERKGRPVGRYQMLVSVREEATQIAVLEGRNLIEHYVSRPADDVTQIHGNIYLGRVQNVLPGMEAAFVDIGTPKNAVLYRGDVQYDAEDIEEKGANPRIEQLLRPGQSILCQVTKNPIAHKGARLTQEVSLPGRFVVLVPNSSTYGISKRLPDVERKRLRKVLDEVRPEGHGIIVRTAAENVTAEEIKRDVANLVHQAEQITALASRAKPGSLLYREPDLALRVIREEFNADYRSVVIDDETLYTQVRDYVAAISPELVERVTYYDRSSEPLPLYERHHVHEQLHKALDRKVWLPSGGSLIIEHTEALTVIDVNTGKNVGSSSLEETVFRNNLEAAGEIARQLRLRNVGGIIVIDFIDMEVRANRDEVVRSFREALARDKTRTQVFEISELGLVEMTRKRIGESLLESVSGACPECEGRGIVLDAALVD